MTDTEIIKALECCKTGDDCKGCPYCVNGLYTCGEHFNEDILDLINRQKAEIERLKHNNITIAQHSLILCQANYIEGVKDFAKRFKEKYKNYVVISMAKINNGIDNLEKEMVGDDNG